MIFASGNGTNAENIIHYFSNHRFIQVKEVLSNNPDAFVHERVKNLGIPSGSFSKWEFQNAFFSVRLEAVDFIVLAGFLWFIPAYLIDIFPDKIINLHPSLLPKFGGKGMYGHHVHEAVIKAREKQSGITIHLVNKEYDKGKVLFQATCEVTNQDMPDSLAQKIHKLEQEHFPKVIEKYVQLAKA